MCNLKTCSNMHKNNEMKERAEGDITKSRKDLLLLSFEVWFWHWHTLREMRALYEQPYILVTVIRKNVIILSIWHLCNMLYKNGTIEGILPKKLIFYITDKVLNSRNVHLLDVVISSSRLFNPTPSGHSNQSDRSVVCTWRQNEKRGTKWVIRTKGMVILVFSSVTGVHNWQRPW